MTGLEIWNQAGTYQIDGASPAYVLTSAGTLTSTNSATQSWAWWYGTTWGTLSNSPTVYSALLTLPYTPTQMVAFQCSNDYVFLADNWSSNGLTDWLVFTLSNDSVINYYVFDLVNTTPAVHGVGFEIYNGNGNTICSSVQGSPICISDLYTFNTGSTAFANTYNSGRDYAVIFSYRCDIALATWIVGHGGDTRPTGYANVAIWGFKCNSDVVYGMPLIGNAIVYGSTGSANTALVVDVTYLAANFIPTSHTYISGSGTETIPAGASNVVIEIWGGGGSGGSGIGTTYPESGGAGGFGSYLMGIWSVSSLGGAGSTFTYSVGAGGTVPAAGSSGNSGGTSSVLPGTTTGFPDLYAGGGSGGIAPPPATSQSTETNGAFGNPGTTTITGSSANVQINCSGVFPPVSFYNLQYGLGGNGGGPGSSVSPTAGGAGAVVFHYY